MKDVGGIGGERTEGVLCARKKERRTKGCVSDVHPGQKHRSVSGPLITTMDGEYGA